MKYLVMTRPIVKHTTPISWIEHDVLGSINSLSSKGILWEQDDVKKSVTFYLDISQYNFKRPFNPLNDWHDARDLRENLEGVDSFNIQMSDYISRNVRVFRKHTNEEYRFLVRLNYGKNPDQHHSYYVSPSIREGDLLVMAYSLPPHYIENSKPHTTLRD